MKLYSFEGRKVCCARLETGAFLGSPEMCCPLEEPVRQELGYLHGIRDGTSIFPLTPPARVGI